MKRLVLLVAVVGFVCLLASAAFGKIIQVPTTEYPTIQAGIDAASSGDTVQVAAVASEADNVLGDRRRRYDCPDHLEAPHLTPC